MATGFVALRGTSLRVIIAMDSFKGSIMSMQAGAAVKNGLLSVFPHAEVLVFPMADGGEGTVDAMVAGMGGVIVNKCVTGPLGLKVDAAYGIIEHSKLAIIEIMQAAGLTLVMPEERNPMNTTTYGVGELILDALDKGCREFIIGLGGSATNDAGLGMLSALGFRFFDDAGNPVGIYGKNVADIRDFDIVHSDNRLKACRFNIASDVSNPLCGKSGASAIFGPQKGASAKLVKQLDSALSEFSQLAAQRIGYDYSNVPGSGAAGGLGFGFLSFLNASVRSGVEVVIEAVGLETAIKDADIVITGEGKLDAQTVMGKVPQGVAGLAKKHGAIVVAFSGCAAPNALICNEHGIDAFFPIISMPLSLEEAMDAVTTERNLTSMAKQVFLLVNALTASSRLRFA